MASTASVGWGTRWIRAGAAAVILASGTVGMWSVSRAYALAPEPDPIPKRWELDVKLGPVRAVNYQTTAGVRKTYLYLTYKVTNRSAEDVLFAPTFELSTSDTPPLRSGKDVPAEVTQKILDDLANPFLQDQIGVLGMLLQGDANAREGLVVWAAPDHDAPNLTVYAAGFSGETRKVEVVDPLTKKVERVTLRKQLMTVYRNPGELRGDTARALDVAEQRWVLR